jgi:hypothetical protein
MRCTFPPVREAIELICPFVFSVTGLLTDGAILVGDPDHLEPALRFALVAGAPALAAIAAIKAAGDDRPN